MRNFKKLLSVLLTVLLTMVLFPLTAYAADAYNWTGLQNALNSALPGEAIHIRGSFALEDNISLVNGVSIFINDGATLTTDGYSITIDNGYTLEVQVGCTLNNNGGTITNNGRIDQRGTLNNTGTITNNGTIDNSGTITGGGTIDGTNGVPPNITTTSSLPGGTVNTAYSQKLLADNSPTGWSLASGSLPAGLNLSGDTISGAPTVAGTSTFNIKATNAGGSYTKQFSITVAAIPPGAPTIGTATAGDGQATISFTAPTNNGGETNLSYTVTSNPDGKTATGASSPLTVTGLTNGTAYTFTVTATNSAGTGLASAPSNSVTPQAAPTYSGGGSGWYVPPTA